jgi:hypothetical protein
MKQHKFKKKLSQDKRPKWVDKLLNIQSFTDEEIKYGHIYRVLKMLHLSREACERAMREDYGCSNIITGCESKTL